VAYSISNRCNYLRGLLAEGEVEIEVDSIRFPNGQLLLDWVVEVKTEVKPDEVFQTRMDADKRG
jgi:hypothetical protein